MRLFVGGVFGGVVVFGCLCLFLFASWFCFCVLFYVLCHSLLLSHTSCRVFSCLSGRALDLRVDLRLVAPSFFTSLKLGLPVS